MTTEHTWPPTLGHLEKAPYAGPGACPVMTTLVARFPNSHLLSDSSLCSSNGHTDGQKLGKYLLSLRTNFWKEDKTEFQALKTKEPAMQCEPSQRTETDLCWDVLEKQRHFDSKEALQPNYTEENEVRILLSAPGEAQPLHSQGWPPFSTNKSRCFWLKWPSTLQS